MERLRVEDILIPDAKLEVKAIDENDPIIKLLFEETKKRQDELRSLQEWTQENYDGMKQVITI